MSFLSKLYSRESIVEKIEGRIRHVSLRGRVHIGRRVLHCPRIPVLLALREAKRHRHNARLLVHRERGHVLGRRFESSTVLELLEFQIYRK